jgi:hypothetical protein
MGLGSELLDEIGFANSIICGGRFFVVRDCSES